MVDDNGDVRRFIAQALTGSGYHTDTTEDGAAAWEALQLKAFNLLITDNNMPKLTGVELVRKLRSARMTLPVIMVTAKLPTDALAQNPSLQLAALLPKPFSIGELLETVRTVLHEADGAADGSPLFKSRDMKDNERPPVEKPAGVSRQRPANFTHRILVVDDDSDTRQLSIDVLAGSGYDVEAVIDGAAGWDALQANRYDLTITDNKMPKMTGLELIEKLRSARMALPVIMATRYLPVNEFARRPWLKPDAMLQRPFSNDDLLETVQKILCPDGNNDGRNEALLPKHF